MNRFPPEYGFLIGLFAVSVATGILWPSSAGFLTVLLFLVVAGTLVLTRMWKDRGFYLVCSGEPLVVACGLASIWAGLVAACMLAGIFCGAQGLLESRRDLGYYGAFSASAFLIALLIHLSNHVLLPLLVLCGMTAVVLAVQSVRTYQLKKRYAGGAPP